MNDIPIDEKLVDDAWSVLGVLVSQEAWQELDVEALLAETMDAGGTRTDALRRLADQLIQSEPAAKPGSVTQGKLLVASLIKDVQRYLVDLYTEKDHPDALDKGFEWVSERLGDTSVEKPLLTFAELYPPTEVRRGESDAPSHLDGEYKGRPNRHIATRELSVLYLAVLNRAMRPFLPLFDDAELRAQSAYTDALRALEAFFDSQPPLRVIGETLFRALRAPMEAHPDDLEAQLAYIVEHWIGLLPGWLKDRLLRAQDMLREETQMRGGGPGPPQVGFYRGDVEFEAFTPDRDWMSNVVLIAKQTHVWLDQLSRAYGRSITRLDQVPDDELDRLARWGFTGLWLIGVWERSPASSEIKRRMGNPEALASAYSLYDYVIAENLGGDLSYDNLSRRANARGIKLAADMVPNHVGIYSKWVIEHPDWFIQLNHPPYPGYQFNGADLSWHSDVEIRLEDGYWDHTDAAVVFQRRDSQSGELRYIYHGNDGTQMPWNDTAQLDYLNPEVREAAVQTILHVARMFPIIRFDAAMTLAKRHLRRLWFPAPGEGGAIPSRSQYGISQEAFDAAIPKEFWREVVERVGEELPDTLLMAEAFWMMEGYFVRTLGMHRVYNSAFMNMLKMEENSKYRTTIKDVLEFSPEILKRFVNFMNNPDERTAIEQFGKGDKYFGICTMLVTTPGLPMFGHGQIEGYTEKYGMEYARAYWNEEIDRDLVARHEREIFPLMRRRHLFSQAENFVFYDFFTGEGHVNEDVFAYSNRGGGEAGLVIYNNAYRNTSGWVRTSTGINIGSGDAVQMIHPTLGEGLALNSSESCLYAFREHNQGLQFLRTGRQLADEGLFVELHGYQTYVFLDWRELDSPDDLWWQLYHDLNGSGVPDIEEARLLILLRPAHDALRKLVAPARLDALFGISAEELDEAAEESKDESIKTPAEIADELSPSAVLAAYLDDFDIFLEQAAEFEPGLDDNADSRDMLEAGLTRLQEIRFAEALLDEKAPAQERVDLWRSGVLWCLVRSLGSTSKEASQRVVAWRMGGIIEGAFSDRDSQVGRVKAKLAPMLLDYSPRPISRALFEREDVQSQLLVHEHEDIVWFHKERLDQLLDAIALIREIALPDAKPSDLQALRAVYRKSAFQYAKLIHGMGITELEWVPEEVLEEEPQEEANVEDVEDESAPPAPKE